MENLHGGGTRQTLGKEICESEETGNSHGYSIIHCLTLTIGISDKTQTLQYVCMSNMIHFTAQIGNCSWAASCWTRNSSTSSHAGRTHNSCTADLAQMMCSFDLLCCVNYHPPHILTNA